MKPAPFEYIRPTTVADTVAVLAEADEAKVLAGGQSLVPVMNFRLAEPPLLVDINAIEELSGVQVADGRLRVGAVTRTRVVERSQLVREQVPLLAHAASWVGHVQIRNRGTVGGSVTHGHPSAELPAICLLLDAEMTVQSAAGTRILPAADFFQGLMTTAVEPDELLTDIHLPIPSAGSAWGFSEYAQRHGDFALAGAACVLDEARSDVRLVAFGPSSTAMRCPSAEHLLASGELDDDIVRAAADAAVADVEAATRAQTPEARHRVRAVQAMVLNALRQCMQRKGV